MRSILLILTLLFLFVAFLVAFREAPPDDAPLSPVAQLYNKQTIAETSVTNVIAAINFDWRAYDTLGESSILLTAATGVFAMLRRYLHRRRETGIT